MIEHDECPRCKKRFYKTDPPMRYHYAKDCIPQEPDEYADEFIRITEEWWDRRGLMIHERAARWEVFMKRVEAIYAELDPKRRSS